MILKTKYKVWIAPPAVTKTELDSRIALGAFPGNSKTKKAKEAVSNVRVVINSVQALLRREWAAGRAHVDGLAFLLPLVSPVTKANTNWRKVPRFAFRV